MRFCFEKCFSLLLLLKGIRFGCTSFFLPSHLQCLLSDVFFEVFKSCNYSTRDSARESAEYDFVARSCREHLVENIKSNHSPWIILYRHYLVGFCRLLSFTQKHNMNGFSFFIDE